MNDLKEVVEGGREGRRVELLSEAENMWME